MAIPLLPIIGALTPLLENLLERIPDAGAREKAKAEADAAILALLTNQNLQQIEVNKAEVSSGITYTAAWRPTIGFVLAAALGWSYVIGPVLGWLAALAGHPDMSPPNLMDQHLWELILGMLGLAGWRTIDKVKGTP